MAPTRQRREWLASRWCRWAWRCRTAKHRPWPNLEAKAQIHAASLAAVMVRPIPPPMVFFENRHPANSARMVTGMAARSYSMAPIHARWGSPSRVVFGADVLPPQPATRPSAFPTAAGGPGVGPIRSRRPIWCLSSRPSATTKVSASGPESQASGRCPPRPGAVPAILPISWITCG